MHRLQQESEHLHRGCDTAAQLKTFAPGMRVLFYLHTEVVDLHCYAAYATYLQHPEWWLYDDAGLVMNNTGQSAAVPLLDYTIPAARAFWVSIPLNGSGSSAAGVIDGLLADGAGPQTNFCGGARLSGTRCAALVAAKQEMVREAQALFNATNGGTVVQNSMDVDPGLATLTAASGVMAEHFAAFEYVTPNAHGPGTWGYNAAAIAGYMDRIAAAAAAGKTVVVAFWVGPASVPFTALGFPSWPLGDAPTTLPGWRVALSAWHSFALAGFLTIAQPNVWMQYQGWYTQFQGAIGCNGDATCVAPEPWYPDLYQSLGQPLGPAVRVNNSWTRRFERAVSYWNLDAPNASGVTWLSATATCSGSATASPSGSATASVSATTSASQVGTASQSGSASTTGSSTGTRSASSTSSGSSTTSLTATHSGTSSSGGAFSTNASTTTSSHGSSSLSNLTSVDATASGGGVLLDRLTPAAVAGISVAAVVALAVSIAGLLLFCTRRRPPLFTGVTTSPALGHGDPVLELAAASLAAAGLVPSDVQVSEAIDGSGCFVESPIMRAAAGTRSSYRHLGFDAEHARHTKAVSIARSVGESGAES